MPREGEISKPLEDLADKVIRPDKRLKAEDLVASELATAILSEPLSKIRHVCEALMLLDDDEQASAQITEEENKEALRRIYPLCQSFRNVFIDRYTNDRGEVIERSATIRWPFEFYEVSEWAEWLPEDLCYLKDKPVIATLEPARAHLWQDRSIGSPESS